MEECDVQLLLLGKLCKGSLDLPKWVTSRVDRDFRIDKGKIAKCQDGVRTEREKRKRGGAGGKGKGVKKKKEPTSSSKAKSSSREASVHMLLRCLNLSVNDVHLLHVGTYLPWGRMLVVSLLAIV